MPSVIPHAQLSFHPDHLTLFSSPPQRLPLPCLRPRLTLIPRNRMQHDLIRQLRCVILIPLTPIITDRVREDVSSTVEVRRTDCPSHLGIPFQPVLRVLVPEVESSI